MKENKARVEDALHATRAAVEEGIVAGGGVMLVRAAKVLDKLTGANDDQTVCIGILRREITEQMRQIVKNAGEEASVVLIKLTDSQAASGYNPSNGHYAELHYPVTIH